MLRKIGIISTLCFFGTVNLLATLQTIVVPACNFYQGTSLVLIACDLDGVEKVAGCISFQEGKTQFSQQELITDSQTLGSIQKNSATIIADVHQGKHVENADDALIYLYFEIDDSVTIIRAIVIKNNFLVDNPFDIVEIPVKSLGFSFDIDNDDFFDDCQDNSGLPIVDPAKFIQPMPMPELTWQDKVLLTTYILWEYQAQYTKQIYIAMLAWCKSKYAE